MTEKNDISPDMARLEEIMKQKGIEKSEFLKAMSIESQHYNNWKNRGIPGKKILKVSRYVREHAEWIDSGDLYYAPSWRKQVNENKAIYKPEDISEPCHKLIEFIKKSSLSGKLTDETIELINSLILKIIKN